MSGEGAVGYAVVAVVGGSVWLGARAVGAGALVAARSVDLLGAGLVRVGEHAQRTRAQWEADQAAMLEWEAAARQVIEVNARLTVLRNTADLGADLLAELPAALAPCTESPAQLRAWCATAAEAVAEVERTLVERTSRAVLAVLGETNEHPRPVTAEQALVGYQEALAAQALQRRPAPRQADPSAAVEAVARIVGRLSVDASPADRAAVLAAAAQVSARRPDVDHDTLLEELRLRVQRAEERARARRADALRAATMLQALTDETDPDLVTVRAALSEVVAGRRGFDRALGAHAERAAARVRVRLERDYVRRSVTGTLAELGYEVDEGFATVTGNPERMRLVRADWDGHAVQVVVDGDEVRAAVVRLEDRTGTDARREDVEREQQWCRDLEKLRADLDGAGVQLVERRLVAPGKRVPPVVKRRDTPAADRRPERRERSS